MNLSLLLVVCALLCVKTRVQGRQGVKVSLEFVSFRNPYNKDLNNQCCDPGCFRCNYFFKICLKEITGGRCVLSARTKQWDNTNDIVFTKGKGQLGNSNDNPLVKELSSWKGNLKVAIDVMDDDKLSSDDLVDKYSIDVPVTPTAGVLQQSWTDITVKGIPSSMVLRYSVQCNRDYYGPRCTTYCMARDDSQGHYTCNLQTGSKVCRVGWYGSNCLTYCVPRDDDIDGHYTCHHTTGNKICRTGWHGGSCKTFCMAKNDSQAGYTCDLDGKRICLSNWYPSNRCEVQCKPRNDSSAGYTCDTTTGQKTCLTGWNGPECDCKPRNDSTAAYCCNATTGERICHAGWYSIHCNIYCIPPKKDSTSHYSCNPKTGAKECLPNWFGKNCDVYCPPQNQTTGRTKCSVNNTLICARNWYDANCSVLCEPRDDNEVHYICNQETGQKICHPRWYGDNCSTHCVPRNNDWFGHFDCDSDGNKQCHPFWYGKECKVYCTPQNNSQGYYRCRDSDGARVCLENWFGSTCLTFCQERNNDIGHYRCDNVDGNVVCLQNWYGDNCTVNCAPRDDSEGHFTCDDRTGQKFCLEGWTGLHCEEIIPTSPKTTEPTTPALPPRNEERKKTKSGVKKLSELAMALILGGVLLLIVMTVSISIIICSRRQTKRPAKPFPYMKYHTSNDSLERKDDTSNTNHGCSESDTNPEAKRQSGVRNLMSQYDDENCRNKDVFINLQEVSWNEDGSRKIDDKLVMYNNPLFTERKDITTDVSRTDPRIDPITGLRDNSDWVAIFESYND